MVIRIKSSVLEFQGVGLESNLNFGFVSDLTSLFFCFGLVTFSDMSVEHDSLKV